MHRYFHPFSGSPSRLSIVGITIAAIVAFGSYLSVQTITEQNVRQALLEQQMQRQIGNIDAVSARIASDIRSVTLRMELLATEPLLQNREFASDSTTALLTQELHELNKIAPVEGFHVIDENDILANTGVNEHRQFIGLDVSQTEYLLGVKEDLQPHVSASFIGFSDKLAFAIAVPILNRETERYVGSLVTRFVLPDFFSAYEDDLQISNIVALDRNLVYISTTIPEFLGLDYWGEHVQTATRANPSLNEAYATLASGKPASTLFVSAVTNEERFVSGSPIFYGSEQVMSVIITTPTAAIYSHVDDILFAQKIQMIAALAAVVGAILILILYLSKWNRALDKKVKERTSELETANKRLTENDKMQKEFINIAAHELRTPMQPILGLTELMVTCLDKKDKIEVSRAEIELLGRNADRLERLSSQILDVALIEGGSVKLNLEPIDISTKVKHVIENAQSTIKKDIDIRYIEPEKPLTVKADRTRLFEVLSNLLGNAIKFTEHGIITISAQQSDDGKEVIVKVVDTGSGIDPEIMPRLFTKFATKSESGTGIGLYLTKNIVEAHGGRIWAENNRTGGATFSFTLALTNEDPKPEDISHLGTMTPK